MQAAKGVEYVAAAAVGQEGEVAGDQPGQYPLMCKGGLPSAPTPPYASTV